MKRFFIILFSACSMFMIMSCFIRKAQGKKPVTFNYVLDEIQHTRIGYNITNDIKELSSSMKELNNNTSFSGNPVNAIVNVGKNIYYVIRFFIKLVFHSLIATLNIMILVLRVIGFESLNYINIDFSNVPYAWTDPNGMVNPLPDTPW